MEMVVILAAAAALVFAGVMLVFGRGRGRPPLRLPHEQELEDRGDELFRDFDQDLAGVFEQAAHQPEVPRAYERLEAPRPRPQGPMTIDHDPAEPGLPEPETHGSGPGARRPHPQPFERDGDSR